MLDAVCIAYYGEGNFDLDLIYAANPGLAARGPVYASGVIINLPNVEQVDPVSETVRLWD